MEELEILNFSSNKDDELFEVDCKILPQSLHNLKINTKKELFPNYLEPLFTSWTDRQPQKSSLILIRRIKGNLMVPKNINDLIENFKKL